MATLTKGLAHLQRLDHLISPLKDVHIDHVTAFPPRVLISLMAPPDLPIENVTITNNLFSGGMRQITSAGGGPRNCATHGRGPSGILNSCFSNIDFTHNLIIGGGGGWPKGNIVVGNAEGAGIRDFRDGSGGDYRLCREKGEAASCKKPSPGLAAGTDGKDIGADLQAIETATKGVL